MTLWNFLPKSKIKASITSVTAIFQVELLCDELDDSDTIGLIKKVSIIPKSCCLKKSEDITTSPVKSAALNRIINSPFRTGMVSRHWPG